MKISKTLIPTLLGVLLATGSAIAANHKSKRIDLPQGSNLGSPKIVGGGPATQGQQRWITSVQYAGQHFCGGSLIGRRWVLTAAHCMAGETANGSALSVWIGGYDLNQSQQGFRHDVVEIITHPQYDDWTENNDIALLRLDSDVSQQIPLVNIATAAIMSGAAAPNQPVTVSGWGDLAENGPSPSRLHEVVLPLVSNAECNSPQAYGGEVTNNQLCAGLRQGGKDSCQGDSGGPLWVTSAGVEYHVGIVSWGEGCALPNKYGVYTRTANYQSWIAQYVQPNNGGGGGNNGGGGNGGGGNGGGGMCTGNDAGELFSGETLTGLSAGQGALLQYYIDVPPGQSELMVRIWGGNGDADLYLALDREATPDDHDFGPYLDGNNERVRINNPTPGRWHVTVHGYAAFSNLKLRTKISP